LIARGNAESYSELVILSKVDKPIIFYIIISHSGEVKNGHNNTYLKILTYFYCNLWHSLDIIILIQKQYYNILMRVYVCLPIECLPNKLGSYLLASYLQYYYFERYFLSNIYHKIQNTFAYNFGHFRLFIMVSYDPKSCLIFFTTTYILINNTKVIDIFALNIIHTYII